MTNTGIHGYRNRQVRMSDGSVRSSFVGVLEESTGGAFNKRSTSRTTLIQDKAGSKRVISRLVFCHPTRGVIKRGFIAALPKPASKKA